MAAVHETAEGLHRTGTISDERMREFDEFCLDSEPPAPNVLRLRTEAGLSQNEFAGTLLRVRVARLRNWEEGKSNPTGPALQLLSLYERQPELMKLSTTTGKAKRRAKRPHAKQVA